MASSSGCARGEVALSLCGVAEKDARAFPSEARATDQRFPRTCRLTARRQFVEVYNKGWRVSRPSFTIFGLPNGLGRCRLGLTVTRKVGSAVSRNRVKRVLRDCFRRNREDTRVAVGLDLVVNARPSILRTPGARLERELVDGIAELARRVRR